MPRPPRTDPLTNDPVLIAYTVKDRPAAANPSGSASASPFPTTGAPASPSSSTPSRSIRASSLSSPGSICWTLPRPPAPVPCRMTLFSLPTPSRTSPKDATPSGAASAPPSRTAEARASPSSWTPCRSNHASCSLDRTTICRRGHPTLQPGKGAAGSCAAPRNAPRKDNPTALPPMCLRAANSSPSDTDMSLPTASAAGSARPPAPRSGHNAQPCGPQSLRVIAICCTGLNAATAFRVSSCVYPTGRPCASRYVRHCQMLSWMPLTAQS